LNLTAVAEQITCHGLPAPQRTRLTFASGEEMADGDRCWRIATNAQLWYELDRIGQPYLLINIGCQPATGVAGQFADTLVLFDQEGEVWHAVAVISPGGEFSYHADTRTRSGGGWRRRTPLVLRAVRTTGGKGWLTSP